MKSESSSTENQSITDLPKAQSNTTLSENQSQSESKSSSSTGSSIEKEVPSRRSPHLNEISHSRSSSKRSTTSSSSNQLGRNISIRKMEETPINSNDINLDSGLDSDSKSDNVFQTQDVSSETSSTVSEKPILLPREKVDLPTSNVLPSKLTHLDYTRDKEDGYSYVVSKQFDADRNPIEEQQHPYE